MREKINHIRHISILFLTILIFFFGILIGGNIEDKRIETLYTQLQEQDLAYQNVLTESKYITSLIEKDESISCDLIIGAYFTSISNLDSSRLKLEQYISTASVKQDEYYRLQGHYSNLQVTYWLLGNQILNLCEKANFETILYFFDERKNCPACQDQGVHLNYVKQLFKDDVLIFSFNVQREGVVRLLSQRYYVFSRETPVLVIGDEVLGFSSNQEIIDILCEKGVENSICE